MAAAKTTMADLIGLSACHAHESVTMPEPGASTLGPVVSVVSVPVRNLAALDAAAGVIHAGQAEPGPRGVAVIRIRDCGFPDFVRLTPTDHPQIITLSLPSSTAPQHVRGIEAYRITGRLPKHPLPFPRRSGPRSARRRAGLRPGWAGSWSGSGSTPSVDSSSRTISSASSDPSAAPGSASVGSAER